MPEKIQRSTSPESAFNFAGIRKAGADYLHSEANSIEVGLSTLCFFNIRSIGVIWNYFVVS